LTGATDKLFVIDKQKSAKLDTIYQALPISISEQGGIRTPDLLIRSQKLYPLSYLPMSVL
jgi:hypothetical protein